MTRAKTSAAIDRVLAILDNPKAKHADQLRAAEILLDRGWGKPSATVDASITTHDALSGLTFAQKRELLMQRLRIQNSDTQEKGSHQ